MMREALHRRALRAACCRWRLPMPSGPSMAERGRPRQQSRLARRLAGGGLEDDVEIGQGERSVEAVPGGLLRIIDGGELLDQALLDREYRVRFDVRAAGDENVRGQRAVPASGDDEMNVRGTERVPLRRVQQRADRAVGGYRVIARHDGAEPERPVGRRGEQAA